MINLTKKEVANLTGLDIKNIKDYSIIDGKLILITFSGEKLEFTFNDNLIANLQNEELVISDNPEVYANAYGYNENKNVFYEPQRTQSFEKGENSNILPMILGIGILSVITMKGSDNGNSVNNGSGSGGSDGFISSRETEYGKIELYAKGSQKNINNVVSKNNDINYYLKFTPKIDQLQDNEKYIIEAKVGTFNKKDFDNNEWVAQERLLKTQYDQNILKEDSCIIDKNSKEFLLNITRDIDLAKVWASAIKVNISKTIDGSTKLYPKYFYLMYKTDAIKIIENGPKDKKDNWLEGYLESDYIIDVKSYTLKAECIGAKSILINVSNAQPYISQYTEDSDKKTVYRYKFNLKQDNKFVPNPNDYIFINLYKKDSKGVEEKLSSLKINPGSYDANKALELDKKTNDISNHFFYKQTLSQARGGMMMKASLNEQEDYSSDIDMKEQEQKDKSQINHNKLLVQKNSSQHLESFKKAFIDLNDDNLILNKKHTEQEHNKLMQIMKETSDVNHSHSNYDNLNNPYSESLLNDIKKEQTLDEVYSLPII